MNYYVVSPNVYNDGDNYAQKMFSKGIAAVGWDTDRQKGQQFDSITQGDCIIVAQRVDWQWTYYYMGIVLGNEDKPSYGTLSKRLSPIISLDGIDLNFEDWTANGSNQVPSPQRIDINSNINIIENIKKIFNMQKYTDLLKSNYNLILTGAPGTGKTFLAKQIAQQMIFGEIKDEMNPNEKKQFDEQCDFVQFHPSYDYTDFVEGLRPVKSIKDDIKNIGFERKDGAFKAFCKKALDSTLPVEQNEKNIENYEGLYSRMIASLKPGDTFTERGGKKVTVADVTIDTISLTLENESNESFTKERLIEFVEKYSNGKKLYNEFASEAISGNASAYWAVANYFYEYYYKHIPFVFIIDEINRGEISKIFGELFFSIDPGYRGTDGKVRTQYANMQTTPNDFDQSLGITDSNNYGHFFVPENVYIIGTMNDIDRSVESMDFAFRRRFAFKEITAEDSKQMLDSDDAWGKDKMPKPDFLQKVKDKMDAINKVIFDDDEKIGIEGLSSAYHIGASYFLKLANYRNENGEYDETSFSDLWENHLEGLLLEYMRGMADVQKKIKKLANAYGYSKMNKYE